MVLDEDDENHNYADYSVNLKFQKKSQKRFWQFLNVATKRFFSQPKIRNDVGNSVQSWFLVFFSEIGESRLENSKWKMLGIHSGRIYNPLYTQNYLQQFDIQQTELVSRDQKVVLQWTLHKE